MDYTYTILILLLPFLSFLVLGLAGKWLSHRTAGLFGTSVLGIVTAMSYYTAFTYFTADRINDVFPTLVPIISLGCHSLTATCILTSESCWTPSRS